MSAVRFFGGFTRQIRMILFFLTLLGWNFKNMILFTLCVFVQVQPVRADSAGGGVQDGDGRLRTVQRSGTITIKRKVGAHQIKTLKQSIN